MEIRDFFVINPAAGKKNRLPELTKSIKAAFQSLQRECEIFVTTRPGEATEFVKQIAERLKGKALRFYACGGDGTFQETVQGAVNNPDLSVAPVPIGSGNDFIRTFDEYSKEDFLNIRALAQGEVKTVDALDVNGKISVNVASVGLDAVTAKLMPALRRVPLLGGKLSYIMALVAAFFTATKNRFSFVVDGKKLDYGKKDCIIATAANGKYYGGGFQTAPKASLDDGEMEFLCVPTISRLKFLSVVGIYKKGEHLDRLDFIRYCRCKTVKILTGKEVPVNVDGEIFQMKDPDIRLLEKALNVILPAKTLAQKG